MARQRDPRRNEAFEIFKQHNGDIKLKEIAEQLGISEGTIRGWKNKDDWEQRLNGTFQKKTSVKRNVPNKKPIKKNMPKKEATVKFEIVPSDGLNGQQLLFCMYYTKYWNATKAYRKAYECDYKTANSNAHRLMVNEGVRRQIEQNKKDLAKGVMLDARSVLQKYIDIAFSDVTDFTEFGSVEEPMIDEEGREIIDDQGNPRTYTRSFVHLKNADEIDGTILTEVKKGKDGVSVKLADKMAALAMLAKYTDLLNDGERKQLINEQTRLNINKTKAEIKQLTNETAASSKTIIVNDKEEMRRLMNERASSGRS